LRYTIVEAPLITIASRDIRRRIAEGRSVRYMIPRAGRGVHRGKRVVSA